MTESMPVPVPEPVREALQDAMEIAIANVPAVTGNVVVCRQNQHQRFWITFGLNQSGNRECRCRISRLRFENDRRVGYFLACELFCDLHEMTKSTDDKRRTELCGLINRHTP